MDARGPADDRVEHAEFAPSRVGGRTGRSWGPLLIAAWIVALGAVVGAGTIGRTPDGSSTGARPTLPAAGPSTRTTAVAEVAPAPQLPSGPTRSSDPDPLAYTVVRDRTGLAIAGTILARTVVWVFVSVQDAAGDVLTWRSLSIEDQNNDIRLDHAPAFEISVPLAARLAGGLVIVEVNAYNNLGRKLGSVRQAIGFPADHNPIRIGSSLVR